MKQCHLIIFYLSLVFPFLCQAQNCSVNAGSNAEFCENGLQFFPLNGGVSGAFVSSTIQWSIIQQPTGSDIIIENPNSLVTQTTKPTVEGVYIFRLEVECEIGSAFQEVSYVLHPASQATLQFPEIACYQPGDEIKVIKNNPDGSTFNYEFLNSSVLNFIEEDETCAIFTLKAGKCFDQEEVRLFYRVITPNNCISRKFETIDAQFDYSVFPSIGAFDDDNCRELSINCLRQGDVLWTITAQPDSASSYIEDPTAIITRICNVINGKYQIDVSVTNSLCQDIEESICFDVDDGFMPCGGTFTQTVQYCVGEIPQSISFSVEQDQVNACIEWFQAAGPPLIFNDKTSQTILVEGFESGSYYELGYEITDKISDCVTQVIYRIIEIGDEVGQIQKVYLDQDDCPGFDRLGCATMVNYFINGNLYPEFNNLIENVNIKFELLSYPSSYSFDLPLLLNGNVNNQDFQLTFEQDNPTASIQLDRINFISSGAPIYFWICGDLPSGIYTFQVTIANTCFEYLDVLELGFTRSGNNQNLNAGTDQVLPCSQDSTTLIGNLLGYGITLEEVGYWTTLQKPDGAPEPIQSLVHSRTLNLKNLISGHYIFQYSFPIAGNINDLCSYKIVSDEVNLIVGLEDNPDVALIGDQIVCPEESTCIELPISGNNVDLVQVSGPSVELPNPIEQSLVCLEDLAPGTTYEFEYIVSNDCSEYTEIFSISTLNTLVSPAQIITPDTCFGGAFQTIQMRLEAEVPGFGNGRWSYNGPGNAIFSPSPNAPNVEVEFKTSNYAEFVWTVSGDDCPNQSIDKIVVRAKNLLSSLNLPLLIEDCNADFPYNLSFDPIASSFGMQVLWQVISYDAAEAPLISDPSDEFTDMVFYGPGEYTLLLTYSWDGECNQSSAADQIQHVVNVRLSSPGSIALAGDDFQSCDFINQLNATPIDNGSGEWKIESVLPAFANVILGDPNSPNSSIAVDGPTKIILSWNAFGALKSCGVSSKDEICIEILAANISNKTIELCDADAYLFEHGLGFVGQMDLIQISGDPVTAITEVDDNSIFISGLSIGTSVFEYSYTNTSSLCEDTGRIVINNIENSIDGEDLSYHLCFEDIQENNAIDIQKITNNYNIENIQLVSRPGMNVTNAELQFDNTTGALTYTGYSEPGSYIFSYDIKEFPCEFTGFILVDILEAFDFEIPDFEFNLCFDTIYQLDLGLSENLFYNWQPDSLVSDPADPKPFYLGSEPGVISVMISNDSDFNTCVLDTIINIAFVTGQELNIEDSLWVCFPVDLSYELEESVDQLIWSFDADFDEVISTSHVLNISLEGDTTIFVAFGNPPNCVFVDSIVIGALEPELYLNDFYGYCHPDEDLLLSLPVSINDLTVGYAWTDELGNILSVGSELILDSGFSGIVNVNAQIGTYCNLQLHTEIRDEIIFDEITATASPEVIFEGESSQLSIENIDADCLIIWSPSSTLSDTGISDPLATPTETTTYTVSVEKAGCILETEVTVEVRTLCFPELEEIPNLFTPNGDGSNDCFRIEGEFESIEMYIYNRWGEMVKEMTDINDCWDGYYDGRICTNDVYGFWARVVDCDLEERIYTGNVTLLR